MDLLKLSIALLAISYSGSAISNGFTRINVDEPAKAQYMRTSTYLELKAKLATVGSTDPSLKTTAPTTTGGQYVSAATTSASSPKIATNVKIPVAGAAGAVVAATLTANVTKAALAKAALAMVRLSPMLSAVTTLAWLANAGLQYFSSTDEVKEIWKDSFQGPSYYYNSSINNSYQFPTSNEACTWYHNNVSNPTLYNMAVVNHINPAQTTYYDYCQLRRKSDNGLVADIPLYPGPTTTLCNTGYTLTSGKCMPNPGTPLAVFDDTQAEARMAAKPISGSADTAAKVNDALNETIKNDYIPETTSPTLKGPNGETSLSTSGPTSTTTKPDGSVTVNSTTINTTFNGDTAQISQTDTSTTTPAGGSPETTTTTKPVEISNVEINNQTSTSSTETPANTQTDCDKYPNSVGCSEYGTIEPADVITPTEVPITLNPTSLGDGICPVPKVLNLVGQPDLTMSYQPYCDFATGIKPIVVAFAWLSAGFIVFGAVREG